MTDKQLLTKLRETLKMCDELLASDDAGPMFRSRLQLLYDMAEYAVNDDARLWLARNDAYEQIAQKHNRVANEHRLQ